MAGQNAYPLGARIANALLSYQNYLVKVFVPLDLSIFYPFRMDISTGEMLAAAALLSTVSLLALVRIKKQPSLFVGWCWFLGTLLPVIGIAKIGDFAMADRYMYMPLAGILLASIWLAADLFNKFNLPRLLSGFFAAAIVGFSMAATWHTLGYWKSDATLFQRAASAVESNYLAHLSLGHVYGTKGELKKAERHFQTALKLRPEKLTWRIDLGRIIGIQGRFSDALHHFQTVLAAKQDSPKAHFYTGVALIRSGENASALAHILDALKSRTAKDKKAGLYQLYPKLERLHSKGTHQKGLELLHIYNSPIALKRLMAEDFNKWLEKLIQRHESRGPPAGPYLP